VALQFMLMVPGIEDADFSSLEVMVYGASPISEEVLVKSIEVFKCKFWQAYGLTETTGAVVNLAPDDHDVSGPNRHRSGRAARPARASSCASSATTAPTPPRARSARSGSARAR
jgi:acyl-CoA synthetase (AMP-forming)/AMP-acid ligase II